MDDWQYRPAADQGLQPHRRWQSVRREVGLTGWLSQAGWRVLTRAYLRLYHRLRIDGASHLPGQPRFVVVANHASHLDALTLAAALPWRLRQYASPIAAGDVFFETPAAAFFAAMMLNALPMWRRRCGSHALQELRDRLTTEPAIYILFPEGTRSRDGQMGPFKPGIGMMIAGTGVPVVPCHIAGAHAALAAGSRCPRPARLHVRIGAPLVFTSVANSREGWVDIARQLERAVKELAPPQ